MTPGWDGIRYVAKPSGSLFSTRSMVASDASKDPKVAELVESISSLTLLQTADLIESLKVS